MPSTISDDLQVNSLSSGSGANPPVLSGGSGVMDGSNKSNGSIHMRTDEGAELLADGSVRKINFGTKLHEMRIGNLTANSATTYVTYMPARATIVGVKRRFTAKPASASGTVVTGITVDGNAILASSSEDEKSISDDTLTAHNLTGTSSFLNVDQGDKIVLTTTSNHADMTGGTDMQVFIEFKDR